VKIYFKLQYNRLIRGLKHFGINPYLGIILALAAFIIISNLFFKRIAYAQYLYPLAGVFTVYLLGEKNRNEFLQSIFTSRKYHIVRLVENLILIFPLLVFLTVQQLYLQALGSILICGLISLYNKVGKSALVVPSPFYKNPFEFTIGFRRNYAWFIVIYIIASIAACFDNFNLGMFTLLAIMLLCMSFYANPEPDFYVWVHSQSPGEFLKSKIKTAVIYTLYVSLPIALIFIVLYPTRAYIPLLLLLVGLLYAALGVVSKYSNFPQQISLLNILKIALSIIFPPILLLTIPYLYKTSVKKLNAYLT
jgi:hypothetical protein